MVSTKAERTSIASPVAPAQGPVAPSRRIEAIDVLRGLALFGVLVINLVFAFRVSIFEQLLPPAGRIYGIDRTLTDVLTAAIELKAFALFSFLFGLGLAIQFDRLTGNPRRLALLMRRLVVLLAIGAAHLFLLFNGDIPVEYAVAGLVVLPFLFAPRWLILLVAAASVVLFLTLMVEFPSHVWVRAHLAEALTAYGDGGFLDVLAFRVREVPALLPFQVQIFPRTIALFLLGALAWRSGILQRPSEHQSLLLGIAIGGVLFGGALTIAAKWGDLFDWRAHEVVERLGGIVLAAGYAAGIVGLANLPAGQRMLGWAAPVGRMAFTNYLVQSLVLGWIFYGYGFGLFGRLSVAPALAIAVVVYAVQAAGSAWWLGRYRYGPVEWLWRSLMYGARQPMGQGAP